MNVIGGLCRRIAGFYPCRTSLRGVMKWLWYAIRPRLTFCVVSCSRNAGEAGERCLESVYRQHYPRHLVRHLFVDDASDDDTDERVQCWLATHPRHNVTYYRNPTRTGGTTNTLEGIRWAVPGSIVLEVNGDDWLADGTVIPYLNRVFSDRDVWMTYNSFRYMDGRMHTQCRPIPESVIRSNAHRAHEEFFGRHLHAFRRELFDHVNLRAMIDPATGQHWVSADDQALYLCMFELAGHHVRHIDRVLYVYNFRPLSHEAWDAEAGRDRVARIRGMQAQEPLEHL